MNWTQLATSHHHSTTLPAMVSTVVTPGTTGWYPAWHVAAQHLGFAPVAVRARGRDVEVLVEQRGLRFAALPAEQL